MSWKSINSCPRIELRLMRKGAISGARKRIHCVMGILSLTLPLCAIHAEADEKPFATRTDESVLLLGDHTVARTSHLTQRFFPAAKHPANPLMKRAQAWEGVGPYLFGSRVMQDPTTRQFRLW